MEYTFQYDGGVLTQVELKEFQLIVRKAGKDQTIPFSAITNICLQRKRNFYSLNVRSTDFGSVHIYCKQTGSSSDTTQLIQYNTFTRVLHLQLIKSHCPIEYCSGLKPARLIEKVSTVFILSLLGYSIEDYFRFTSLNPMIFAFLILLAGGISITVPYFLSHCKSYQPGNIPLNMLPPVL